ncbi:MULTISPECIES: hypothetical protein [Shewanella]|uniref:Uncharacterized protein n=1 Tax=Shewanella psychromarinicola TaxID=2487742 RepID=A0A3N4DYV8_9GAMM|nr:hypothetical protein [Shewanella psychromarinicola]AZG35379.1 hypothetical protein EGC80_10915 [Shewanella psychromarinicola]MCL1083557.1 hypothetical protein [Shewanella psychromarinicola]RPA31109.1 hypothetical protein EGC77_14155 [Shewanella psychromarinicola]
MVNAAVCQKSQSGETSLPTICSLTVGSWDNGAKLYIASFRGWIDEARTPQGMGQPGAMIDKTSH